VSRLAPRGLVLGVVVGLVLVAAVWALGSAPGAGVRLATGLWGTGAAVLSVATTSWPQDRRRRVVGAPACGGGLVLGCLGVVTHHAHPFYAVMFALLLAACVALVVRFRL
jgi:hypothetical protein